MIRTTLNETSETVDRSILGESYETIAGSADGAAPDATVDLTEVERIIHEGLFPANTYPIIPSNSHNGPKE